MSDSKDRSWHKVCPFISSHKNGIDLGLHIIFNGGLAFVFCSDCGSNGPTVPFGPGEDILGIHDAEERAWYLFFNR